MSLHAILKINSVKLEQMFGIKMYLMVEKGWVDKIYTLFTNIVKNNAFMID